MTQDRKTPHPTAHGRHPLPSEREREMFSFSLGEKVAEGRGRMRGFFQISLRGRCIHALDVCPLKLPLPAVVVHLEFVAASLSRQMAA